MAETLYRRRGRSRRFLRRHARLGAWQSTEHGRIARRSSGGSRQRKVLQGVRRIADSANASSGARPRKIKLSSARAAQFIRVKKTQNDSRTNRKNGWNICKKN